MSTTSTVDRAFGAALYDETDTALDTGASLLAADAGADAEVARRGEQFVAAMWRRGWQPADVVRVVRRELDDPHVRLVSALIVREAGDRPTAGPRWAAQLAELDPRPPHVPDRFSYATAVLELYRLLLRLPALEPLDAPEGPAASREPESRMLTRIRALLAKAEATGYPEEAEALSAKAQELMARHSIDEALLAARTHARDVPGACRIGVDPPYETAKAVLLDAVASANRCRSVWHESLGFSTVIGFEADLEAVELLHTSLLVQATTALTKAEAAQRKGGRKRTKTFKQSFLAAYAHRVGDRLRAAAQAQVAQSGEGSGEADLLPVLAARDVAVADRTESMFPHTVTTRMRAVGDVDGWEQGAAAADRAQVAGRPRLP
ncbi:DUF2786 domain-containing protein [Streptomyces sp. NPDC048664]|uniref:DUF2786 domain-containing protein n=1 Tax=Streptomyces sp. NPDC048664 TaxID=3154505 RepID=UPI00341C248A